MPQTPITLRKIVAPLVLVSFLIVAFLGFSSMSYESGWRMAGGCPFSAIGTSLCPQDTVAVAMHHISAYESFLSAPVGPGITALISALLLVSLLILKPSIRWLSLEPPIRSKYTQNAPPISARLIKITRWLSLLENSPSFA